LHNGCIDHIHNTFVCTMNAFAPMNALHIILYHLTKLHPLCHEQSYRTNSCLFDGHLMCANHCIFKCRLCLLFLHVYLSGDTLEYLDCAMSSTSSNYKSVHDNRFHGDEVFDPRSDLSQGRGDDAEHPTSIPMYTTTTPQAPSGPMTRPQAYAIGHKVNPLLNASPFHSCETWLLPNARTLLVLRNRGDDHGVARGIRQVHTEAERGLPKVESPQSYSGRTSGRSLDIWRRQPEED
jgi:hypothetical protein